MIKPVLKHGCGTTISSLERNIKIFKENHPRREGYKEWREKSGQSVSHDMKPSRLRWELGHASRTNPSGSLFNITNASRVGKKALERPKTRWIDRLIKAAKDQQEENCYSLK